MANSVLVQGNYEYYKGLRYDTVAIAPHSESLEEFVVYQALYGSQGIGVRPLALSMEMVL